MHPLQDIFAHVNVDSAGHTSRHDKENIDISTPFTLAEVIELFDIQVFR